MVESSLSHVSLHTHVTHTHITHTHHTHTALTQHTVPGSIHAVTFPPLFSPISLPPPFPLSLSLPPSPPPPFPLSLSLSTLSLSLPPSLPFPLSLSLPPSLPLSLLPLPPLYSLPGLATDSGGAEAAGARFLIQCWLCWWLL